MANTTNWCTDKLCRLCLCESTNMRPLSDFKNGENITLLEVLSFISNLNINTGEKLPRQICKPCEGLMIKAEAFKRRCIDTEAFLNRFIDHGIVDYLELETLRKTLIKHEIVLDIDKLDDTTPDTTPIVDRNPKSLKEIDVFDTILKTDSKVEIFEDFPLSSTSKDLTVPIIKNVGAAGEENIVKMEENDDFDSQMDFDETDSIPLNLNLSKTSTKEYSCACGNIYNTKEDYKTHLRESYCNGHQKSKKIKIEKKNSSNQNLTTKKPIICLECNLEFDSLKAFKLHRRKHKAETSESEEQFHCNLCMRKFNRKSSYTNHMKHHNEKSNIKFTCDTCKREFQHKAHLDNHILNVHTREKGFPCEHCNTNFATQKSLELHKESHKVEKKHQCTLCSKAFIMLSTLNDHMRTHTGEKPFLCNICGKGFSQKTNLAQHMRRHQGLKPFKCDDCERRFVSKGELVAHKRKHSGAHPFVCDECGSGFTTSSSLVKHRRTHTGERPYVCDLCSARFAASGTLKNHRRTHTGEKPFQCSYCEKAFVQRHDLISHIRCHTGERPFVCGCGQAFRKASALKAHVRMHAKEPIQGVNLLLGVSEGVSHSTAHV